LTLLASAAEVVRELRAHACQSMQSLKRCLYHRRGMLCRREAPRIRQKLDRWKVFIL